MEKTKPDYFFVVCDNDKLRISWKRGLFKWERTIKKIIVKVVNSKKNYIWHSESTSNFDKPFKNIYFSEICKNY